MSITAMSSCWGDDFPVHADGLSAPAIRVVALAIADVVNDTYHNEFYGSLTTLAAKVGLSRDTVRRIIRHLTDAGVVSVKREIEGKPTVYTWLWTTPQLSTPRGNSAGSTATPRGLISRDPAEQSATNPIDTKETTLAHLTMSEFDEWWTIWPKKVAKGGARKAFARARKTIDLPTLLRGAEHVAAKWKTMSAEDRQFVPYPERWLSKERWNDIDLEVELGSTATPKPRVITNPDCPFCGGDGWVSIEGTSDMRHCECRQTT